MCTARVTEKLNKTNPNAIGENKSQAVVPEACSEQLYAFMIKMGNKKFTPEDEKTVRNLIQKGASVNYCKPKHIARDGKRYKSSYIMALKNGNANVVRMCLEAGANVNEDIKRRIGWDTFPLEIALLKGRFDVVRVLMQHNVDVEKKFKNPCSHFFAEAHAERQRFEKEGGMKHTLFAPVYGLINGFETIGIKGKGRVPGGWG